MKRTPIRKRSRKYEAMMRERRKLVARLLEERPECEAHLPVCYGRSVDVHEILRRSQGGKPVGGADDEYLCLCRPCHTWITEHPASARTLGLVKFSYD